MIIAMQLKRGGKIHPAFKHDDGHMVVTCGCPGTMNGKYQDYTCNVWPREKANCKRA